MARVRAVLAARPELRVAMLMTLRGQPVRQAVRDAVRRGTIGAPVFFHSRRAYAQQRGSRPDWFFDEELSGGPWLDGAIHGVDEIVWISGRPVARVLAARDGNATWPERKRFFDHGMAVCELEGGTTALIEHERLAMNDGLLSVVGTEGKVEVNRANEAVLTTAAGDQSVESIAAYPPAQNVFGQFAESLLNGGPAVVDTEDTLAVMEAALAIRE